KRNSVFGISVDGNAFERVKKAIEQGERPPAAAVNVEALVNYFAGGARRSPREASLEVEGSPAPTPSSARTVILRCTVDTQQIDIPTGGSVPPIGTDARIEIEFDPSVVASQHRVGDAEAVASEPALLKNVS